MSRNFWDYAKGVNRTSSIEDVFSEWVNINNLTIDEAKKSWDSVNEDLRTIYASNIPTLNQNQTPETSVQEAVPPVENMNKDEGMTLIKGILTS